MGWVTYQDIWRDDGRWIDSTIWWDSVNTDLDSQDSEIEIIDDQDSLITLTDDQNSLL